MFKYIIKIDTLLVTSYTNYYEYLFIFIVFFFKLR